MKNNQTEPGRCRESYDLSPHQLRRILGIEIRVNHFEWNGSSQIENRKRAQGILIAGVFCGVYLPGTARRYAQKYLEA
jgi:hypothetical protein